MTESRNILDSKLEWIQTAAPLPEPPRGKQFAVHPFTGEEATWLALLCACGHSSQALSVSLRWYRWAKPVPPQRVKAIGQRVALSHGPESEGFIAAEIIRKFAGKNPASATPGPTGVVAGVPTAMAVVTAVHSGVVAYGGRTTLM